MDEGNHAVNVSAATINQVNEDTRSLQIVPVLKQSGGNRLNTYAFLDIVRAVSFIDQSVQEKLQTQGTDVTLKLAGIHGKKDLKTERFPLKIKNYIQMCIQSKPFHSRQSTWETQTTTTSQSKASIT